MPDSDQQKKTKVEEYTWKLCEEGHRGTGTPEERRAAEWLEKRFEDLGLEVTVQRFRTPATYAAVNLMHAAFFLVAYLLWWADWYFLAGALGMISLISMWGEFTYRFQLLRKAVPQSFSQNVIGRRGVENPRRTVIFSGHLDSAYTGFLFRPDVVKRFHNPDSKMGTLLLPFLAGLAMTAVFVVYFFGGGGGLLDLLAFVGFAAMVVFSLLSLDWLRGKPVPGANDNASGIAATLALAEEIVAENPDDIEYYFIGFGAEEAHLSGSLEFLAEYGHRFDPKTTTVINFDGIAAEKLWYVYGENMMLPIAYPDQELAVLADRLSRKVEKYAHVRGTMPKGATDAIPFALKGFKAITLLTLNDRELPLNYHTPGDSPEKMTWEDSELALEFARDLVRGIED